MKPVQPGDEFQVGDLTVRYEGDDVMLTSVGCEHRLDINHSAMLAHVLTYLVGERRGRYGHAASL